MSTNNNSPILVVGGTGTQGGNVARELLRNGHRVRVLSRDPASEAALKIASLGAEVVRGDLASSESLLPVLENIRAVFSVQYADPADPSAELRNARNLVEAARKTGVAQVVHTSAAGTNVFPKWDQYPVTSWYLDHKYAVEELFRNGEFRYWTILHPCWFMENFTPPLSALMAPGLKEGRIYGTVAPDAPVKLNSGAETARLAVVAFEDPEKFNQQDLNIASDELSWSEIVATISKATGKQVAYEQVSRTRAVELGMLAGTAQTIEWIAETGFGFDLAQTREYGIPLKTFAEWAGENRHRIFVE